MTVEVCLRRAGTTRAALVDMIIVAVAITNESMILCKRSISALGNGTCQTGGSAIGNDVCGISAASTIVQFRG